MNTDSKVQGTGVPNKKKDTGRNLRRRKGLGLAARVIGIERNLASAAWHTHREMFGSREDNARAFSLELRVVIEPGRIWRLTADPPVEQQIRTAVQDMASHAEVYRSGRVYCYRCESTECPHSVAPWPTSVFGGYSSTGLPQWPDLGKVLLDLHHPDVDLLYQPYRRHVVAAYVDPETLKHRQLNVFGRQSKTYDILGQVVFGFLYLTPPGRDSKGPERVAFTLQAVESRHLDGSPRLELNVLGQFPDGSSALDALTDSYQLRILHIVADARRRIGHMAPRDNRTDVSASIRSHVPVSVVEILKGMVRSLERIGRQTERRTMHAEERRVDKRPTTKACEDAVAASDDNILWDDRQNTVVVLGPRNRIHIFSPQGRHVTSLTLGTEAIRGRIKRGRWQHLTGEMLVRFRAHSGSSSNLPTG